MSAAKTIDRALVAKLSGTNPLIANGEKLADTIDNVNAALEFIADAIEAYKHESLSPDTPRGCAMLLRTCSAALQAASEVQS